MKNVIVLLIVIAVSGAITFFIGNYFRNEKIKSEIGVYPSEFKTKIYDVLVDYTRKKFLYDFVDSLTTITYDTGKKVELVYSNVGSEEWGQSLWSVDMAKGIDLEEGKDFGIMEGDESISGKFWILDEHISKFKDAVISNHRFIIETKGIELSNDIYYREIKTMLEENFGIDIENEYFKKLFEKYNG